MDFEHYRSPFTWRYGSDEMRQIWSETNKRLMWRRIWVTLADVQSEFGLVSKDQVEDLSANSAELNIERSFEIEEEIRHDLMAEIKVFAEQCPLGGGIIHLGATATDIKDNAEVLFIRQSLDLVLQKLRKTLEKFTIKIKTYADLPTMAHTHIQPAEPTTLGYRFAQYAQDLLMDWEEIRRVLSELCGKGFKGAVGTGASFGDLLGIENLNKFEDMMSERLELPFFPVTTQTYSRKQDYKVVSSLAGLGASLYKFAFDLRILQSPPFGELREPFGERQVGSSAMPFKRNPETAEKIDSLGRLLAQYPRLAWDNASHSLLERTLDDSANRRSMLPEVFLITDELLISSHWIIEGLQVNETAIQKNFDTYAPFAATEPVLMALTKKGADRQEMHERIRQHAQKAWTAVQNDQPNPLHEHIIKDKVFLSFLSIDELENLMEAKEYIGDAPQRARELADKIIESLDK